MFKFELQQVVNIQESGETGTIIGRGEYDHADPSYLVRYKNGAGNCVENWWTETALVAA